MNRVHKKGQTIRNILKSDDARIDAGCTEEEQKRWKDVLALRDDDDWSDADRDLIREYVLLWTDYNDIKAKSRGARKAVGIADVRLANAVFAQIRIIANMLGITPQVRIYGKNTDDGGKKKTYREKQNRKAVRQLRDGGDEGLLAMPQQKIDNEGSDYIRQ